MRAGGARLLLPYPGIRHLCTAAQCEATDEHHNGGLRDLIMLLLACRVS